MTWFLLLQPNMYHLAMNDLYDVITTAQTPYLFAGYSKAYINPRPKAKSIIVVLHFCSVPQKNIFGSKYCYPSSLSCENRTV